MKAVRDLILLILSLSLMACQDEAPEVVDFSEDYRYFPLETGFRRDYQVEERVYRLNEAPQQFRYQVREEIGEVFETVGDEMTYELLRYRRPSGNDNWQLDSVWLVRQSPDKIVRVENNLPFVALRFPLREGRIWDGNVFNTRRRDDYTLTEVDVPQELAGNTFAHTLTVVQNADSSLVNKDVRTQIYARDTGMVFWHSEQLFYCADPNDACFGQNIIERGREITYTFLQAGKP